MNSVDALATAVTYAPKLTMTAVRAVSIAVFGA